jgi:aldehyde dehydrogenase (NAD+)
VKEYPNLYIGGQWVSPHSDNMSTVINPSTEEVCAKIASGDKADVDAAVRAAREAFDSFSQSSRESRVKLLRDVVAGIQSRADEFAEAINQEMGAPLWWAQQAQVPAGIAHFATAADVLEKFKFVEAKGTTHLSPHFPSKALISLS